ncbi:MAG: protein-glutamate O-methyltransferase CheR [Betaproteobacteria bacterium]|nr:protein-glutamate O-methyltransferase CheR [Betaproteobacteria bacterium]
MTDQARHDTFDYELGLLLDAIYHRYQHDFRHYAVASLRRRVRQAMQRFGCRSVSQLQDRVLHEPDVFAQTLEYLTVQVSEIFRDPGYFQALRSELVPFLKTYPSIKAWVAGCSAGEEVISIAILLHEERLLERSLIYATDINPRAIGAAKAGMYPIDRVAQFSQNYLAAGGTRSLSDYYHAAYGSAIFDRALRQRVLYADHSLATDAVFSEVHFVSCRNVLIYFDRELQDRSLTLFRDALVHRGYLGLGSRENLHFSSLAPSFAEVPGGQRIYRKL